MKYGVTWSILDSEGYYKGQNGYIDFDGDWASEACTCPMEFDTLEEAKKWAEDETKRLDLFHKELRAVCLYD